MGQKKRDDEKFITILVCGIFTGSLIFLDIKYGLFGNMNLWVLLPVILLHLLLVYSWFMVVTNIYDPAYDKWRYWNMVFAVAAILAVMFHRADRLNTSGFWEDVNKNKQENTK